MTGAVGYRQVATMPSGNSSVTVTLDHSFADTNYTVCAEVPYQTSWWITNKAANQFDLHCGTTAGYDQSWPLWIYHE